MSFLIASGHVEVEAKTDKALSGITAIVGAMGALGPVGAVAAGGAAAAGAGLAAFGLAAGKQVANLAKASQAHSKYQEAVDKSGKQSAEAVKAELAYQQTLSKMPRATREATAAFSALNDSYESWSDSLAGDTMPVFTKGFQIFSALLPKTTGLVKGTSAELDRMMVLIAGGVASPGFDRFMGKLETASTGTLRFVIDGVIDLSRSVAGFAEGGGFDGFMDTAQEAGPLAGETLANLAKAMLNVTAAGGDVGISLLTVANALAKMVNAIPPEALSAFLQLYAAMKLFSLGAAAVATVTGSAATARLAAYFAVMRAAGVGPTLRATAASMSGIQKAAIGLGVLAVAAIGISKLAEKARGAPPDVDRLTTSLKNLAQTGKFTGELQKTFGDLDGLVEKVKKLNVEAAKANETAFGFRVPVLDDVADWIANKTNDMAKGGESLTALKEDFAGLDQAMAGLVGSGHAQQAAQDFEVMKTALLGAGVSTKEINKLFPEYQASVSALKADQALAAQGMGLFGQQAMSTKTKLDEQKRSADGLRGAIQALNDIQRQGLGGMIGFEAAIDAAAKAAMENKGALEMNGGVLNLNSEKARNAATALQDLAQKTDDATGAARESGASWETVNGIYSKGRSAFLAHAQAMGLDAAEANKLANEIMKIPDKSTTTIEMRREDALAGLDAVISKIKSTPGSKSVTVSALTQSAIKMLESVGFKTKTLPDGRVVVTALTGSAQSNLAAVKRMRDSLSDRTITITTHYRVTGSTARTRSGQGSQLKYARGGRVRGYAGGGEIQSYPDGGLIQGPGTGTSDSVMTMFASGLARTSNTEYVVKSAAVAKYGVRFMDELNAGRLRLPGYAKGGLTAKQKAAREAAKRKADERRKRQQEARGSLTHDATLTDMSRIAGVRNAEISSKLGKERSEGALVDFLNKLQTTVSKAGFSPKTNSALQKQITASARKLFAQNDALDKVTSSLGKARGTLDDLKGKFDSLKTSISSSLVGFGNITKIGKYGTSPETLIKQLQSDTIRTTDFAKQLEQLKAKGLNSQAIADIAQAGVAGGGMATAQSLLNATPEQIAKINELQKQLTASANKAGKITADAMYGAGIKAAEGIVAGLTAKQKAIETAMMTIAKGMEAAIKKALGIRSPAKRLEPIGDFAFQGVERGWTKRMAKGNTLISGSPALYRPSMLTAPSVSTSQGASTVVNVTLSPTFNTMTLPSASERKAFARAMAGDISDAIRERDRERRR